jgi:hypothetical protein
MKRFNTQVIIFCLVLAVPICFVFAMADGSTDSYYLKFTTPKQQFLILGSSRAAQGIKPSALNPILRGINPSTNFFNYAFTINHSPYGPTYLNSIQKKTNQQSDGGIFILSVDPWSISAGTSPPNDSTKFGEHDLFLAKTKFVSQKPNFFYLINSYDKPYYEVIKSKVWKIIDNKNKPSTFVHDDGWLEVNTKMDSLSIVKRVEKRIEAYHQDYLPVYQYSALRLEYLKKTIRFLQNYGTVYLVRLPVSKVTLDIENQFMPDFNAKIDTLSAETNAPYNNINDSGERYLFVDENHLYKTSAEDVSKKIGYWILQYEKEKATK